MTLIWLSLGGLAWTLAALFIGYSWGTTQTWREMQAQVEVWQAHTLDLSAKLDECNGVKVLPLEARK